MPANEKKIKQEKNTAAESVQTETTAAADAKKGRKTDSNAALAGLETKLEQAEQQLADATDRLLRTTAEYENYRRRSQKEHDAAFNNGVAHAAVQLLPVLDTLDAAAHAQTSDEDYKKGVLLTLNKCEEVFAKLGICEINALGTPFDPELHNAVMQEEMDGVESGHVARVVQKGYTLNDRVIRHAMVVVAP